MIDEKVPKILKVKVEDGFREIPTERSLYWGNDPGFLVLGEDGNTYRKVTDEAFYILLNKNSENGSI